MNFHNITYPDMNNGSGLRVVLWLSGCDHRCKGCQNPQTWDANSGIPFDEKAEQELFENLEKEYISGITLTGGDPLNKNNVENVLKLVNKIHLLLPEKTIWLYSGYTWETIWDNALDNMVGLGVEELSLTKECEQSLELFKMRREIIKQCDVLIDGRYVDSLRNIQLKYRGSENQRVIDIKKSLEQNKVVLWCD